ncbi:5-oxoprolinase subunit C family protein [Streptomyces mutabilis]
MTDRALAVVRAGALTTVQDRGRPGYAHVGVPRSGALDGPAAALVNRLVGNPPGVAVVETTLTGCALRPRCPVTVAVGGAPCPVTVGGRPVPCRTGRRSGRGAAGRRGGRERCTRLRGRLGRCPRGAGPRQPLHRPALRARAPPLSDGTVLPLGRPRGPHARVDVAPQPAPPVELVLRVTPGPRADWFTPGALRTLTSRPYRVSSASNRIGLRLDGPALRRARTGELSSEGMVLGAVQIPPDGRPVVFLADHPTTGGYPVIGVLRAVDLPAAGQAAFGTSVRFVAVRGC